MSSGKVNAIVLAGERPGGDPLAQALAVPSKALIMVAGETMVSRIVRTLEAHPRIDSVIVLTQRPELIEPILAGSNARLVPSEATIAATMQRLIGEGAERLLVTTVDNVLLDGPIIDDFLDQAEACDLAIGVVERRTLLARFPGNRRTWLRFRGGAYSGANLFWVKGDEVLPLLDIWAGVEQQRKRGRALMAAFGPLILFGALFRVLDLPQALVRVGRRHGMTVRAAILPFAEACIDIDKPSDLELAERILTVRATA